MSRRGRRSTFRSQSAVTLTASPHQIETPEALRAIFLRFLKFGCLAWGGPAAQIAMIKRECVDEEGWVSEETFKKTLAVYQVLPGPEAHELCVYFGRLRGGKLGGFLAGLGFMLPGFLLMLALSALYVEADTLRQVFNDTDADALWLVVGAPPEAANTLEMDPEQLAHLYPDGPKALPPELGGDA